jgi:hypothetical protein
MHEVVKAVHRVSLTFEYGFDVLRRSQKLLIRLSFLCEREDCEAKVRELF